MTVLFKSTLSIALLSIFLIFSSCNQKDETNPETGTKVGDYLPGFTLMDQDDKPVSLSDFSDSFVLVEMWASWCSYCNAEAPELNNLYSLYRDNDFEIIGISIDENTTAWKDKIISNSHTYTQVIDPHGFDSDIVATYNVTSIPKMFLLNKEGVIVLITTKASEVKEYLDRMIK